MIAWFASDSKTVAAQSVYISVGTINTHFAEIPLEDFANRAALVTVSGRLYGDLVRSTGQPPFEPESLDGDVECEDDLESPSGGCVVTWAGPTSTGVVA